MARLPPLNSLRAFEAAARRLSFKDAAEELCVTQGAVSRHIAKLEDYLGLPLFMRLHRRVELTSDGEAYLRDVQEAFLRISDATTAIAEKSERTTLTVKMPPTSAIWWLVPRLGRFHARHPEIQVQVTTTHLPVTFDQEEVDVGLQYGPPDGGSRLVVERLFGEVLIPICSRRLLEATGPIETADDIARQVLLRSIRRPHDWRRWFEHFSAPGGGDGREIVFENSALTYQAAIDGLGVALAQLAFVVGELDAGRIVAPAGLQLPRDDAYYLLTPRNKERLPRVRIFRDWIAEEAAATRSADPAL